jgi:hypothetical protein
MRAGVTKNDFALLLIVTAMTIAAVIIIFVLIGGLPWLLD